MIDGSFCTGFFLGINLCSSAYNSFFELSGKRSTLAARSGRGFGSRSRWELRVLPEEIDPCIRTLVVNVKSPTNQL